jgi:hypothetical protein
MYIPSKIEPRGYKSNWSSNKESPNKEVSGAGTAMMTSASP